MHDASGRLQVETLGCDIGRDQQRWWNPTRLPRTALRTERLEHHVAGQSMRTYTCEAAVYPGRAVTGGLAQCSRGGTAPRKGDGHGVGIEGRGEGGEPSVVEP